MTGSLADFVRRHDPDRYLTALFAPAERRETLFVLYAFNHELARAWEVASHPMLALIRLQWWREVLEGAARAHEVATPLLAEVRAGRLDAADLLALIEGRELLELGLERFADWQAYVGATAGRLAGVAGRALGAEADTVSRLHALGSGYGVAGTLRLAASVPAHERPALVEWGRSLLGRPAAMDRRWLAAGLVGVLARRDLRRPGHATRRGLGDRLAVTWAAARVRV